MASVFQRNKVEGMFAAFDADGDGYLRRDDFEALVIRWGRLPGVEPGTDLRARVEEVVMGWWEGLRTVGDADRDGRVDIDELLALVDLLPTMREAVTATADTLFDAVDENGDGRISRSEHRRLIETWHGQSIDTDEVFDLLDLDGDGYLSRPEFAVLWSQFWISDDPAEPGNLVCGRIPSQGHPRAD
ncbi:EF-hand domain-containing protein [Streptomyces sp. SPB162]|uniref:EF-hand domain-containing protein n=1 Tax=Streptomyces sp. SPB162 TaxID=2940560 RepID=UPI002404DD6B|nr:EF-hand domain-containing protein [Streptomyces sp. SPB162]MDF9810833.1 Ca2+-binding EF-hand superfamily protein [Streptomyces sp. SPB162]